MPHDTASQLRFSVLGPIRARRGDTPLDVGSPLQRAVLCALLLRGGRTATAPELVDAVWGESPPAKAVTALRTYAFRLRRAMGAEALASVHGGYALRVAPGALDTDVCEELEQRAERERAAGRTASARALLGRALELWGGEPLAEVPGPYARTQRARLAEWGMRLLETRLELDLELGRHAEAVAELTALSAEHPLRERLRCLLMLALYRSGRQAEALGVHADTRRLLADELGVDPGPELTGLYQRVLRADPDLAGPMSGTGQEERELPVMRPAQLPAAVADFTGREAFVTELSKELCAAGGAVMAVSAVAGIGGVGKTALAVHVAHAATAHFPDGQLYVDLQGAGPRPAEPETVLGAFLRALGTPDSAIPEDVEERAALYRSVLAGRRVLALLDNARGAAQVRPLLPGAPGCAVLITSRSRMVDLPGAHLVDLDVMSPEEALALFTRIVGGERVAAERDAALDVVAACGFLPLAIRIAASRLATRRTWTVTALARKLADERRRLDELRVGELAVTACFELGYGQLEPAQARAFRLLALAEGPDISLSTAAAALGLEPFEAEELLESLVDISLLESAAPGRYRYHDLLRLYARGRAEQDESEEQRRAVLSRLVDFLLATASHAYALENPGDRLLDHLARPSLPGLTFEHRQGALDWMFNEAVGLLAAVQQAAGHAELVGRAADLLLVVQDLMESGAYARTYEQATRAVAEGAERFGDARSEGRARVVLGHVRCMAGNFAEADAEAQRALRLGQAADDPVTYGYAPNLRGIAAVSQRRYALAAECFGQALEAFRADGNRYGEASSLSNVGRAHLELGNTDKAIDCAERGLAVSGALGAKLRLGNHYYALGIALAEAGRLAEARSNLDAALAVFRESRQRFWEGMTHYRLALVELAGPRSSEAAAHADQAVLLLREIGGPVWRGRALLVLGRALNAMAQRDRARGCWQEALDLLDEADPHTAAEARGLLDTGRVVSG